MSGHMLVTPMAETHRTPLGERWCFRCRKRRAFAQVIESPIVACWCPMDERQDDGEGVVVFNTGAYYGPTASVRCETCNLIDGDCFPGTAREWSE